METTATSGYNTRCEMQVKSGGSWKRTKGSWIKINDEWHKFGGGAGAAVIDEASSSSTDVVFETLTNPFLDDRNFLLVRFETVGTYTLSVSDAGLAEILLIGGGGNGSSFGAPGNTSAGGAGGGDSASVVNGKFLLEEGDSTIVIGDRGGQYSTITSPSNNILYARGGRPQGSTSNAGGWGSTTTNTTKSGGYGTQSDITGEMLPYAGGGGAGSTRDNNGNNAGGGRDGGGNGQSGTGGGNGYPATTFGSGGGGAAWRFPDQGGGGGAGMRGVAYIRVEI